MCTSVALVSGSYSLLANSSIVVITYHTFTSKSQGRARAEDVSLKSQVVYSKQPKLGLTQEFVVDCAHALWVVRSIKRLV